MDALTPVRAVLAGGALAGALAIGGAVPASAASTGLAAEFPVGSCIDYQNDHRAFQTDNLLYVTAVSCTDPARDYRVTAQVPNAPLCDSATNWAYTTRDMVVLCVVNDRAAPAPPVFGG